MTRPECERFTTPRQRAICEGTADLSLEAINAYRHNWGLGPLADSDYHPQAKKSQAPRPHKASQAKRGGCPGGCKGGQTKRYSPKPNGYGPGSQLLKLWTGMPHCDDCLALAAKMDRWGKDGCEARIDKIVEDILPRAKVWMSENKPFIHKILAVARAEPIVLWMAIKRDVKRAIANAVEPPASVIYVTIRSNFQNIMSRTSSILKHLGVRGIELTKPGPTKLIDAILASNAKVVFIHALALEARYFIPLAQQMPNVQFVGVCHSQENHVLSWPKFFNEIHTILQATKKHPNIWYAGAEECQHWTDLGYRNVKQFWQPCGIGNVYVAPKPLAPPSLLITSRLDVVKALPSQIIAAALVQKSRGAKVAMAIKRGNKIKSLELLARTAGLQYESWPWLNQEEFLKRLQESISIVLQPSMSETFNYVAWEAGACGRPWIGSRAIKYTPAQWQADPNDPRDIARIACDILDDYEASCRLARSVAEAVTEEHNANYEKDLHQWLSISNS